jgi:ubiquinone biosynthesis protein UbiJ
MTHTSPISFVQSFFQSASGRMAPPQWLVDEGQQRLVLLLNHVLMQEPEAMNRLARQKGRCLVMQWNQWSFAVRITPAGLFDVLPPAELHHAPEAGDLMLWITETSPSGLVQTLMTGQKPPVRIEGDVQLAADINWLFDHVRWDIEEDVAKLLGDAPAYALGQAVRRAQGAVLQLIGRIKGAGATQGTTPGTPHS